MFWEASYEVRLLSARTARIASANVETMNQPNQIKSGSSVNENRPMCMNEMITVELDHASLQEGADQEKLHEDHANQWGFFLMNLKGYLEAAMDLRKEKLNMITR